MHRGKEYLEPKTLKFKYKKECSRKYINLYIKVKLTTEEILVRVTLFQCLTWKTNYFKLC